MRRCRPPNARRQGRHLFFLVLTQQESSPSTSIRGGKRCSCVIEKSDVLVENSGRAAGAAWARLPASPSQPAGHLPTTRASADGPYSGFRASADRAGMGGPWRHSLPRRPPPYIGRNRRSARNAHGLGSLPSCSTPHNRPRQQVELRCGCGGEHLPRSRATISGSAADAAHRNQSAAMCPAPSILAPGGPTTTSTSIPSICGLSVRVLFRPELPRIPAQRWSALGTARRSMPCRVWTRQAASMRCCG